MGHRRSGVGIRVRVRARVRTRMQSSGPTRRTNPMSGSEARVGARSRGRGSWSPFSSVVVRGRGIIVVGNLRYLRIEALRLLRVPSINQSGV